MNLPVLGRYTVTQACAAADKTCASRCTATSMLRCILTASLRRCLALVKGDIIAVVEFSNDEYWSTERSVPGQTAHFAVFLLRWGYPEKARTPRVTNLDDIGGYFPFACVEKVADAPAKRPPVRRTRVCQPAFAESPWCHSLDREVRLALEAAPGQPPLLLRRAAGRGRLPPRRAEGPRRRPRHRRRRSRCVRGPALCAVGGTTARRAHVPCSVHSLHARDVQQQQASVPPLPALPPVSWWLGSLSVLSSVLCC